LKHFAIYGRYYLLSDFGRAIAFPMAIYRATGATFDRLSYPVSSLDSF
jgi:hypothetical protein